MTERIGGSERLYGAGGTGGHGGLSAGESGAGIIKVPDNPLLAPTPVRTATVYRTQARALKPDVEKDNYAEAGEPQFQFAVFPDGKTAQRWLTASRSCVWWDRPEDMYAVHIYAHPDYGTKVVWSDGEVEEL